MPIIVTGNPGVGKHTLSALLAESLHRRTLDISALAQRLGAAEDGRSVDTDMLRELLPPYLDDDTIVVGHLAPYVVAESQVERALVLRRSPYDLERAYRDRGYPARKASQNLQSEILGIVAYDATRSFGIAKVTQIDVTGRTPTAVRDLAMHALGHRTTGDAVDWLSQVLQRDDLRRYFAY